MNSWLLSIDAARPWQDERFQGIDVASRGDLSVAVHGWLHETDTLSAELGVNSKDSPSQAALVLAAVEKWGAGALERLRGAFVIAVRDSNRREVSVARDPLGSHPLFFAQAGTRIVFGESTRAVRDTPGVRRDLNPAALADHLCHRWPKTSETFFAAIERVPPGCLVRITGGSVKIQRYWDPAPPDREVRWLGEEVADRFPALFERAVDRCLSSGPGGIFLSGGLDSISVAAAAADRARATHKAAPWALSLAMPDPSCDERETQTIVAKTLGLPQRLVEFDDAVGERGLIAEAAALGSGLSSPLLNIWAPAYLALATRAAEDGVKTVLSGSGGDEWLSVSPYLSADLIARGDFAGWWRFFQAFRRSYRHSALRHVSLVAWTFGARPLGSQLAFRMAPGPWQRRRHSRSTRHDPAWVAPAPALRKLQHERAAGGLEDASPPQGFYLREMRGGLDHPLTSWELEEQYEFGNRTGQRFTHPYWDPDLVDMLYRTPPAVLLGGGRAKGLIREAMARRIPAAGLGLQRKVPGTSFYRSLVNRHLPAAAAAAGACRALAGLGVITDAAAKGYADVTFGSVTNRWDVINLEMWVRQNQ
jgi:asparagine synthase (glutamine-hydrolysing)